MLCCVCFYCEQFAALLVAPIRHCDMEAAAYVTNAISVALTHTPVIIGTALPVSREELE